METRPCLHWGPALYRTSLAQRTGLWARPSGPRATLLAKLPRRQTQTTIFWLKVSFLTFLSKCQKNQAKYGFCSKKKDEKPTLSALRSVLPDVWAPQGKSTILVKIRQKSAKTVVSGKNSQDPGKKIPWMGTGKYPPCAMQGDLGLRCLSWGDRGTAPCLGRVGACPGQCRLRHRSSQTTPFLARG